MYRGEGSLRAAASPLTVTRSRVPMGPSTTAQSAGTLLPPEQPPSRQCGRCRQVFPVDGSELTQPKWWACPACHDKLFGPT